MRPLIALFAAGIAVADNRLQRARKALTLIERARKGSQSSIIANDSYPTVSSINQRLSYTFDGPRGGRAIVIRIVGTDDYHHTALDIAQRAIEALLAPSWVKSDKEHAHQVARACAFLAYDAHPDADCWASLLPGPTGTARAGAGYKRPKMEWLPKNDLTSAVLSDTLPSLQVSIENPSNHGRIPLAITLTQTHSILTPKAAEATSTLERLRLSQLAKQL